MDYFTQTWRVTKFFNDLVLQFKRSAIDTCLNEFWGEFVERQSLEVTFHLVINSLTHFKIVQIDDFLNNKVAKLMLYILKWIYDDILNNFLLFRLILLGVLYNFFHYTKTILILSKFFKVIANIVEDLHSNWLRIARNNQIYHMVTLLIFWKSWDVVIFHYCFLNYSVLFFFHSRMKYILKCPRSFLIATNLYKFLPWNLL